MGSSKRMPLTHTELSDATPFSRAMSLPIAPAIAAELALVYHVVLEALWGGYGNESHAATMVQLVAFTRLIAETNRTRLRSRAIRDAQSGIARVGLAGRQSGDWKLDRATYSALCEILTAFDQQLSVMPFYEFLLANEKLNALIAHRREGRRKENSSG